MQVYNDLAFLNRNSDLNLEDNVYLFPKEDVVIFVFFFLKSMY